MSGVWTDRGCCSTTKRTPIKWTTWRPNREAGAIEKDLDAQLNAALKKIGDDFRPGRSYLEQWSYEVAPYESVRYDPRWPGAKPQSPKRKPAGK